MTETELYQTILKRWFDEHGFFHRRIEQPGVPDLMVIRNGVVSLCELKVVNTTKAKLIKPKWRTGQVSFINEYKKYGGNAWLILYYMNNVFFLKPKIFYEREDLICRKPEFLHQSKLKT